MRKFMCICICLLFITSLSACVKSEPIKEAEDTIITELENATSGNWTANVDTNSGAHNSVSTTTVAPQFTAIPTTEPTAEPTPEPTAEPTQEPTAEPTQEPTAEPTPEPTAEPTSEPTAKPTPEPTAEPTSEPTAKPTPEPTAEPTQAPTVEPTQVPTAAPTQVPIVSPTSAPTLAPVVTEQPNVCEHKNTRISFFNGTGPSCFHSAWTNVNCSDCGKLLDGYNTPALGHDPDEDYWNERNHCKYWVAGSGAFVSIHCKRCGNNLENRPVTATHNYVPTKVFQREHEYDYEDDKYEGFGYCRIMYDIQEYECTNCGKTYTETIRRYIYEDGQWVEF